MRAWMETKPPWRDIVAVFAQAARGLLSAHVAGIVHRDVKPENIFIGPDNWVKLGDFGSTKEIGPQDPSITQAGMIFGTPPYMSPENIQGFAIDHRADLYAVGCLFYELLTGAPPFTGKTSHEIFTAHLNAPTPLLGESFPDLFQGILDGLLEKTPENRYNTTSLLIADLERAKVFLLRSGWQHWRK